MVINACQEMGLPAAVHAAGRVIESRLKAGGKVFTAGNGGSACDAAHLAEELLGKYRKLRRPLPAIHLGADVPTITCIANDFGYEEIFARQLVALGSEDDILVVFSTSGKSPNIVKALAAARGLGMWSILLTGQNVTPSVPADVVLGVPSTDTARIQEIHTLILHTWLEQLESES